MPMPHRTREPSPKPGKCPTSDPTFSGSLGLPPMPDDPSPSVLLKSFAPWTPATIHRSGLKKKKFYKGGGRRFVGLSGIGTSCPRSSCIQIVLIQPPFLAVGGRIFLPTIFCIQLVPRATLSRLHLKWFQILQHRLLMQIGLRLV